MWAFLLSSASRSRIFLPSPLVNRDRHNENGRYAIKWPFVIRKPECQRKLCINVDLLRKKSNFSICFRCFASDILIYSVTASVDLERSRDERISNSHWLVRWLYASCSYVGSVHHQTQLISDIRHGDRTRLFRLIFRSSASGSWRDFFGDFGDFEDFAGFN